MNTSGENRELKKEVQMLRQQINKLEDKLELKENEVI
jgi:cell division protein FtsB